MCDKDIDTCPFVFDSAPDRYITQNLCDKVVSEDPFMLKYCHDKYKTQKMCDKAIDSYLLALKFVLWWCRLCFCYILCKWYRLWEYVPF